MQVVYLLKFRRSKADNSPSGSRRASLLITHEDGTTEWQNTETLLVPSRGDEANNKELTIEELGQDLLDRFDSKMQSELKKTKESDYDHIYVSKITLPDANNCPENSSVFRETDALSPALEINTLPNSPSPTERNEEIEKIIVRC